MGRIIVKDRFYFNQLNSKIYEGQIVDGHPHGYGRLIDGNGKVYQGFWIQPKEEGDKVCIKFGHQLLGYLNQDNQFWYKLNIYSNK